MFNDETLHTWLTPCEIDVKQTEMASEGERERGKSKLKAIRQNKVVIKIIVNSAICHRGRGYEGPLRKRTAITCVLH